MKQEVLEFRVIYRRDGGRKQYRIFQKRGSATRFIDDLKKATREDLAPIEEIGFETRECGPWSPLPFSPFRESEHVT